MSPIPYTSPTTVVTGTTIASAWGNSVKAAVDYGENTPACRVFHSAAQSITTSAVSQVLAFNSERYDTLAMHDNVTNNSRITIVDAGLYLITAAVEFAANATGYRQIELLLSAATFIAIDNRVSVGAGDTTKCNISTVYKFTAGQYLEVRAMQTSGGALNVNNFGQSSPEFSATRLGAG